MSSSQANDKLIRSKQVAKHLGLQNIGKNAFINLCKEGCEPEILGNYFSLLASETEILITPKTKGRRPYKVNLRPLDNLETALKGFEKRDLEPLSDQLKKLAEKLDKLKRTKLVKRMVEGEEFGDNQELIFKLPYDLLLYADVLIPLLLKKMNQVGIKQKPDTNKLKIEIYRHIRKRTGKWHDALVAEILSNISPEQSKDNPITEQGLKQWRHRHKPRFGGNAK